MADPHCGKSEIGIAEMQPWRSLFPFAWPSHFPGRGGEKGENGDVYT